MSKNLLIIITGLPCIGKTTIGKKLATDLAIPFISKDDIREILFDNFEWDNQECQKIISKANYDLLYFIIESILKAKGSLVVENVFHPDTTNNKILDFKQKYNFIPFQIRCFANGNILFDRFKKRAESGNRHEGHGDLERLDEWQVILQKEKIEILDIGGEFFDMDTSSFDEIDYDKLLNSIKSVMGI